jgi:hypothetical protein
VVLEVLAVRQCGDAVGDVEAGPMLRPDQAAGSRSRRTGAMRRYVPGAFTSYAPYRRPAAPPALKAEMSRLGLLRSSDQARSS